MTTKEIGKHQATTAVTNLQQRDFFEELGEQLARQSSIVGSLLKFNKGDWLAGKDEEDIPSGTKLAVNMDQVMVGWVKWIDNKPDQQIMHSTKVMEETGVRPAPRSELGDVDPTAWEVDTNGKPRDPWQHTMYLLMKEPGKKFSAEKAYTFTTSSTGGRSAVGKMMTKYGTERRSRPDSHPIVELGVDSWVHPEYGRVKVPVLSLVGWEPKSLFEAAAVAEGQEPAAAKKKQAGGRR